MVYEGKGLSYTELLSMDLYAYVEAQAARDLFHTEWKPTKQNGALQ